jgi:hypothetical protein
MDRGEVYPDAEHRGPHVAPSDRAYTPAVDDSFNPDEMLARFAQRARAVRQRGLPPIEGPERQRFAHQAALDYQDYAMVADATATLREGILTLTIDRRPKPADTGAAG